MFISAARHIASQIHYPTLVSLGGAAVCASAAAQIAYNFFTKMRSSKDPLPSEWTQREIARMTFFSICALNVVPYTAALGGATFVLHSFIYLLLNKTEDQYDLSFFIVHYGIEIGKMLRDFFTKTPSIISLNTKETWTVVAAIVTIFVLIQLPPVKSFGHTCCQCKF